MWIENLPGFHPTLLKCSVGHDHSAYPVVGLIAARSGGGHEPRPGVHCPSCGIVQGQNIKSDRREFSNFGSADVLGNFMPCGVCLPELAAFLRRALEANRARNQMA
jgi:hypothetical protein